MNSSPASPPIKLLIVDDSELVRTGLRTLLLDGHNIEIVGEASTVSAGVAAALKFRPDVALLDIRLPDGTGFDACRQILQHHPSTRILFLTSVADNHLIDEAIQAGGHGYLLKDIAGQGLVQAIHSVAAGKSILDPTVTARVMNLVRSNTLQNKRLDQLSPQERRVLALIAEGKTNKEVGNELNLSEKTVKNYLASVFEKLNINSRTQAAIFYTQFSNTRPPT